MPKYLKDIFSIIGGASGAHAITLLAYLYLTRIYSPEMFGVLGLVLAVATFVAPMMNLGYHWAINLPSSLKHSKDIYWLSNLISLCFCLLLYVLFIFLFNLVFIFFEDAAIFIILFSPLLAFSQSYINSTKLYLGKIKEFVKVAWLTFFLALITNLLQIFLGSFMDPNAAILIISLIASYLIIIVYVLYLLYPSEKIYSLGYTFKRYNVFFRQYKELAKFRFPHEFFNSASQAVPVLLLGIFFDPVIIGLYVLARTISIAPVTLIGGALNVMISPKLAEIKNNDEKMVPFLRRTTMYFITSGLAIYSILFFYGEEIFSLAFGSKWAQAGRLAEWLSIWFFSMYITSSISRVSPLIKAYADDLNFAVARLFVRVTVIVAGGIASLNIEQLIALFSICSFILNVFYIWWFFNKTKSFDSSSGSINV